MTPQACEGGGSVQHPIGQRSLLLCQALVAQESDVQGSLATATLPGLPFL